MPDATNSHHPRRLLLIGHAMPFGLVLENLQRHGTRYTVTEVADGAAVISRLANVDELRPDCLIVSEFLDDMDAAALLRAITGPDGLPGCAVVVMSARPEDTSQPLLFLGAQDCLSPTESPAAVARAVANAVLRWDAARARATLNASGPDVVDHRRAADELRRREMEYRMLADNTPDMLCRFDRQFRYVFANASVEQTLGLAAGGAVGKTTRELGLPPDLCDLVEATISKVFASKTASLIRFDFVGSSGFHHFEANMVPEFTPAGEVDKVLSVTRDITEHKRHQQVLAEQDKRKNEFLATLSHELRNPLASISSGVGVARHARSPEQLASALAVIERQLDHITHLVDDLLEVMRVSQGTITLRKERLDLRGVVEAAIEACDALVASKQHRLARTSSPTPIMVMCDKTRLVQVVSNLLANAANYSEVGADISVSVTAAAGVAVVTVRDSGIGMAPELLPTIWDMFTRVRDTIDKTQGGIGIGLALVRKILAMHNATVEAASPGLGKGSTFTIRIPLADQAQLDVAEPQAPTTTQNDVVARRVLVVDDQADNADMLAMLIDLWGHQVKTANSGAEALAIIEDFAAEILFVDIGLPEMDGYELARRLRAHPKTASAMIVAVTGWGSQEDRRKSQEAGFDIHLTKPVAGAAIRDLLAVGPTARKEP